MQLIIRQPGRDPVIFAIEPGVYTIGRDHDCRIPLSHTEIADRHAILTLAPEGSFIEDLDSETGTMVNRRRIRGRQTIRPGLPITIGPFELVLEELSGSLRRASPPAPPPPKSPSWPIRARSPPRVIWGRLSSRRAATRSSSISSRATR